MVFVSQLFPQRLTQVFWFHRNVIDCILQMLFFSTGLAYVCEGLKEQRKGLVTLVLWNNQLTHNGMGYLAAALVWRLHAFQMCILDRET